MFLPIPVSSSSRSPSVPSLRDKAGKISFFFNRMVTEQTYSPPTVVPACRRTGDIELCEVNRHPNVLPYLKNPE